MLHVNSAKLIVALGKQNKSSSIHTPEHKYPGDGVLVDQIVLAHPGLIPQMSGFLTNQRLWGCKTSFNHVSDFVYVQLMRDLSLSETLIAKTKMEKIIAQAGRTINHYHINNGRFSNNGFVDAINEKYQKINILRRGSAPLKYYY